MFIMCLSDEKFKKKFEANSIYFKKLTYDKEVELTFDLYKDSYVKLIYCLEKTIITAQSKTYNLLFILLINFKI